MNRFQFWRHGWTVALKGKQACVVMCSMILRYEVGSVASRFTATEMDRRILKL